MARLRRISLVAVVALVVGVPRESSAAPMSTDFATIRSLATTIVVGILRQKVIGNAVAMLSFQDTCMTVTTRTSRSLTLNGKFTGVDAATGALEVDLTFSRAGLAPVTCTLHQIAPIFVKR